MCPAPTLIGRDVSPFKQKDTAQHEEIHDEHAEPKAARGQAR
jgi:hypothetical protein